MLYQIYAITVKELKILLRDPGALSILFIMPVMFILVMTFALNGVFDGGSENNPTSLLVVNADHGASAARVIDDLKTVEGMRIIEEVNGQPLTRESADQLIVDGQYGVEIYFPVDFSEKIKAAAHSQSGENTVVSFIVDPSMGNAVLGPVRGTVQGYVERQASISQAPIRIDDGFTKVLQSVPEAALPLVNQVVSTFNQGFTDGDGLENASLGVSYEVKPPDGFKVEEMPSSAQQNVPGYTIFGIFFILQPLALSIYEEKTAGTFRRLQAAPLNRAALLIGKLTPFFIINLLQIVIMFAVGMLVFHISLGSDFLALALVAIVASLAANGLGLMVTALAKTREQMSGVATLLSVTLAALGGMMVPTFVMPDALQVVSKLTPHAWALQGFQDVMVRGQGLVSVLPETGILLAFATVFFGVALWRFRFE